MFTLQVTAEDSASLSRIATVFELMTHTFEKNKDSLIVHELFISSMDWVLNQASSYVETEHECENDINSEDLIKLSAQLKRLANECDELLSAPTAPPSTSPTASPPS